MTCPVLGWDVGGANLKAARVSCDRESAPSVLTIPFPLWREPERLPVVLAETAGRLGPAHAMAVTMTAELADCFATKREGVAFVLEAFRTAFPDGRVWVYGTDGAFRRSNEAWREPDLVAAANWMASATIVARTSSAAIFMDVGSTTTDIIPIVDGHVAARGRTDTGRLRSGELVYTGLLRTPVCALVRWVPVRGRRCRVAAEHFAIAADVYRWLDRIGDDDYTCDTPDGRGRSRQESGARLARMVCIDADRLGPEGVTEIAGHIAAVQLRQIGAGLRQVMRRLGDACPSTVVVSGQGSALARDAALNAGLVPRDLADELGIAVSRAAPASAVAWLLTERVDA